VKLGEHWRLAVDPHAEYHLYWLQTTGECYLLREPIIPLEEPGPAAGGGLLDLIHSIVSIRSIAHGKRGRDEDLDRAMTVSVLATGLSLDETRTRLEGWETAMADSDGVAWLYRRFDLPEPAPQPEHRAWERQRVRPTASEAWRSLKDQDG
jgi:hypothetical protein